MTFRRGIKAPARVGRVQTRPRATSIDIGDLRDYELAKLDEFFVDGAKTVASYGQDRVEKFLLDVAEALRRAHGG